MSMNEKAITQFDRVMSSDERIAVFDETTGWTTIWTFGYAGPWFGPISLELLPPDGKLLTFHAIPTMRLATIEVFAGYERQYRLGHNKVPTETFYAQLSASSERHERTLEKLRHLRIVGA